jgi:putative FmdB family regulatory protein
MPTYEYVCTKCERRLEVFQKISDPPKRRCPACRGALRRVIGTGAGVIFRGSGFYSTDYRSESYRRAAKAEKESASQSVKATSKTEGAGHEKVRSPSD